jgi:ABC-type phosphate transport system substrate-binding protein
MVNPANDFVECLTVEQLYNIFRTDGYNWNQVIHRSQPTDRFYYPGTDSGRSTLFRRPS